MSTIAKDKDWLRKRNKYRTGYCLNDQCEGTKPKTHAGDAQPTCTWWLDCPCKCHHDLDTLYAMANKERKLVTNDDYRPDMGDFVLPDPLDTDDDAALGFLGGGTPHRRSSGPVGPGVRVAGGRAYAPTPSGIRGGGQLEGEVLDVIAKHAKFIDSGIAFTTKMVADMIAKNTGVEPPSVGAIQAVWERWAKIGFIEMGRKPVSVTKILVENPSPQVLAGLKAKTKQATKAEQMAARRSFRR